MNEEQFEAIMDAGSDLDDAKESIENAIDSLNKVIRNFRKGGMNIDDRVRHNIINNLRACLGDGDLSNMVTIADLVEEVENITEG